MQNLECVYLKCITYAQPIPLPLKQKITKNQYDMYSFVSMSWCAFLQKNDMLLKWSIVKSTSEAKPQRKPYHPKDTELLFDF